MGSANFLAARPSFSYRIRDNGEGEKFPALRRPPAAAAQGDYCQHTVTRTGAEWHEYEYSYWFGPLLPVWAQRDG